MAKKKRKIGFYYLTINEGNDLIEAFNNVLDIVGRLPKKERIYELGNDKFCLADSIERQNRNKKYKIVFKSATHSHRPNLIHKDTVSERENPKQIREGEIEKTHIVTKEKNDTIFLILEKHKNGISVSQLVKYLNYFASYVESENRIHFGFEIVVKENFLEEINKMSRVTTASIIVDKQLLGSEALNYSNRIDKVKHEVVVTVKAKNNDSIEDFAKDIFAKLNRGVRDITKIRIVGRNEENNEVVVNTDFIERQEFINVEINKITGELLTAGVFIEMNSVLETF